MKHFFFTKYIIITGIFLCGFYAGGAKDTTANTNTEKASTKDTSTTQTSESKNIFINQKPLPLISKKRNAFFEFSFDSLHISGLNSIYSLSAGIGGGVLNYGKMSGFLEGSFSFSFSSYFSNRDHYYISFSLSPEFNFIKNDGINKMIPGLQVYFNIEKEYEPEKKSGNILYAIYYLMDDSFSLTLGLGPYLKVFVLDDVALVPAISFNYQLMIQRFFYITASLSVRTYF